MPIKSNLQILASLILIFSVGAQAEETVSGVMQTDFAKIYSTVAKALHKKHPQLFFKSCDDAADDDYRCGEIPFGDITASAPKNQKLAFTVKIPSQTFSSGGASGTFPATEMPIFISRAQASGALVNEKLINRPGEQQHVSAYFGKDIYMRLFAERNQLFGTACIYSPGVTISSPHTRISFSAKKKLLLGLSVKSDITTIIEIQPSSYQAMKSCVAFRVSATMQNKHLEYESEIIAIQRPEMIGFKKGNFIVDVSVKGGNFLGSLVNVFAKNKIESGVSAAIESRLDSKIDKLLGSDIKNGKWVEKYVKGSYQNKLTNRFANRLRLALAKNYSGAAGDISTTIVNQCLRLVSKVEVIAARASAQNAAKEELLSYCQDFSTAHINSFEQDAKSEKLGCYKRYTRITDLDPITKPNPAFLKECKFNHIIEMSVRPVLKPLAGCLSTQWKENFTGTCGAEIQLLQDLVAAQ